MQQDLFTSSKLELNLPQAQLTYCAGFIDNQQAIYHQLVEQLEWQQDTIEMYGKKLKIPRLNCWYGDTGTLYGYSGINLAPLPWPPILENLKSSVEKFLSENMQSSSSTTVKSSGRKLFNSVLGNYYRDENDSVAWHSDDEKELGEKPLIASLSFGQQRRFSLKHKTDRRSEIRHIDIEGGSLLVMAGDMQSHWLHQVPKLTGACEGRVNLTFRYVKTAAQPLNENRGVDA